MRTEARCRPALQRIGAAVALAEALAQRFGAAGQAGDAGGEHGGTGREP